MSYYDDLSQGYDELYGTEQHRKLLIVLEYLSRCELEGPVLDVGCGTGRGLDITARRLGRPVIGIDPSLGMVEQYKGEQRVFVYPAENIPFPDGFFSAVMSITAIQNFDDIRLGVSQIRRVARLGAPIVITCLKRSAQLSVVSASLADYFVVERLMEEEKDIIFFCRKV